MGSVAIQMLNGFGIFGNTCFANQGHCKALRVINVVKPKTAFDAQAIVIGRPITSVHTHNSIVFDVVGEQATHTAEGAYRVNFFVDHL